MPGEVIQLLTGEILEDEVVMSLAELCRQTHSTAEEIIAYVEHGLIEPEGRHPRQWSFRGGAVHRIQVARRIAHDLDINLAGMALVLDLLDEIERLQARLRRLDHD